MKRLFMRTLSSGLVATTTLIASAVMYQNAQWGNGTTIPWFGTFTANGAFQNWGVDIFDMDGAGGPLGTNFGYHGEHGQSAFMSGVPAGLNIYQPLTLFNGCGYQLEVDWSVLNDTGSANFEGGIFTLFNGATDVGSVASGFIASGDLEFGHLESVFKATSNGSRPVGVRIERPFTIPAGLSQRVDNFNICPVAFDGTFGSGGLTNWNIVPTGNGQSLTSVVVGAGAPPLSPLGSGNAVRLQVGQVSFTPGVYEGVSVSQSMHLNALTAYRLTASCGAYNSSGVSSNAEGGEFQLFVGGAVVGAPYTVGSIDLLAVRTGNISGVITSVVEGVYICGVRVRRPFTPPTTLYQYVDNIKLEKANVNVAGRVLLQNWLGDYTYPPLHIYLANGGIIREEHEVNMNASGQFSFETALRGSFDIWVKSTHWLARRRDAITITDAGVSGLNYSLINGDADPDNEVNLVDWGRATAAFGTIVGDPGFDWWADLNGDDEVNLVDLGIISANFGQAGDDVL